MGTHCNIYTDHKSLKYIFTQFRQISRPPNLDKRVTPTGEGDLSGLTLVITYIFESPLPKECNGLD